MYGIIYIARNTVNGKIYVGQTKHTTEKRWAQHVYDANSKRAPRSRPLYNAIKKYGANAFEVFTAGKAGSKKSLSALEVEIIAELESTDRRYGYNVTPGGECLSITPESIVKRGMTIRGTKRKDSHRDAMREGRKRFTDSERGKRILSETAKKRGVSEAFRENAALASKLRGQRTLQIVHSTLGQCATVQEICTAAGLSDNYARKVILKAKRMAA